MKHASARGGSPSALVEPLERRDLLSFDPAKVGTIDAGSLSWKASAASPDYFLENHRIGYMVAALDSTLDPTSYAKGGDPWPYVSGGRYQFKNAAGIPIGTLTLRNVQSTHVTVEKYWAEKWDESGLRTGQKGKWNGVHTDGIYIENEKGLNPNSVFVFEHVDMTEISGGQGLLWEKGSARRIYFKHVHVANEKTSISGRIMLKVDEQTRFDEIIFDDVTANVIFMVNGGKLANALGTVYVHDLSGAQREAIRSELARHGFPVNDPARFVTRLPDDLVDAGGKALPRPYGGRPLHIGWTTTVQAEEYDNGQEGLAYHDTTADTGGGKFRSSARRNSDAVDIISTATGRAVRMVAGEWMDYTIDVRVGAAYDVSALASAKSGGIYRIEFDGIQSTGDLSIGEARRVYLPAGQHVMRLIAVEAAFDVDAIELARRKEQLAVAPPARVDARSSGWGALDADTSRANRTFASVNNISWNDVDGEQHYVIERRSLGEKWQRIGVAAADVVGFSDPGQWAQKGERSGIAPAAIYEYRIVAVDDAGERHVSEPVRIRTGTPLVAAPPRPPVLLSVQARDSGAIQLKWDDRSSNERGFRVERSTDPAFSVTEIVNGRSAYLSYDLPPAGADVNTYVDRGGELTDRAENHVFSLRPGQTYYYRVTAYNSFGHSRPSEVIAVTTPDVRVPRPARDVAVSTHESGGGAVRVSWTAPDGGDSVSGYRIERKRDNSDSWYVLGSVEGAVTEFTDRALRTSNIVTHQYRVVPFNVAGDAQSSLYAAMRVPKSQAISGAPARLRATATSATSVRLEWNDRSTNEAGFHIERSSDGLNWMLIAGVDADQQSFEDTGLLSRSLYQYRVTAFNTNDTDGGSDGSSISTRVKTLTPGKIIPPNTATKLKR